MQISAITSFNGLKLLPKDNSLSRKTFVSKNNDTDTYNNDKRSRTIIINQEGEPIGSYGYNQYGFLAGGFVMKNGDIIQFEQYGTKGYRERTGISVRDGKTLIERYHFTKGSFGIPTEQEITEIIKFYKEHNNGQKRHILSKEEMLNELEKRFKASKAKKIN